MKPTQRPSHYRPDIDGLRALAILPVILFHANVAGFVGGYIGVDVFFVISGFLISSIILRELKEDRFSLLTFWERRARRIIPALVVVIIATLIAAYFIVLYPIDYIDLGQSAIAQAAFLANIFFLRKDDYFAGPSESMPLLHTWSLSVEEQFYIGFPLLMILVFKFWRRALLPLLIALGIGSLAYSYYLTSVAPNEGFSLPFLTTIWGGATNADAAFYLLFTRAFELIIGAVLAVGAFSIKQKKIAEVVGLIGITLIFFSIFFFTRETAFPGLAALIPTLGAGAIILANTKDMTFVGHVLAFPLFIWIGLISYSLYLWHWPILVLIKQYQGHPLSNLTTVLAIGLTFVLAYLTYRYVETPFRIKKLLPQRIPMLVGGLMALAFTGGLGFYITSQNGLPKRAPETAQALAAATIDFGPRRSECFVNSFQGTDEPCVLGTRNDANVEFVLWGDSHAAALLPMIDTEAKLHNLSGASFIVAGCMPIFGEGMPPRAKKCEHVTELAQQYIQTHDIKNIILVSRWSSFENLKSTLPVAPATFFETTLLNLATTYTNEGRQVFIVKQVPNQTEFEVRSLFQKALSEPTEQTLKDIQYEEYITSQSGANSILEKIASTENITLIDPSTILCPDQTLCQVTDQSKILYQDSDHLNKTGAFFVAPVFTTFFDLLEKK